MLTHLAARNFLLIHEAQMEFAPGLNVLTGETGTGKSLLLGALGLALGARARPDQVGAAGAELLVEAVFRIDRAAARVARSHGLSVSGDELILVRRVRRTGPGECFVNGQRVLQRVLRRLGAGLVEVHGQREEERFRLPEVQRDAVDLYGDHETLRRSLREAWESARDAQARLADHAAALERLARDEEWLRFQLREIEEIGPEADELERLAARLHALREQHRQGEWLELAEQLLNGREGSVLEALETLDARSADLPDEQLDELRPALRELLHGARELHRRIGRQARAGAEAAEELPALEERAARLEQLQRKHRKPLAEIAAAAEEMRTALSRLEEGARRAAELTDGLTAAHAELRAAAAELSAAREGGGARLATALERELAALGMRECRLRVVLDPLAPGAEGTIDLGDAACGAAGRERVLLEAETNPGSGFRPVGEIASGGEMARVALALRVALGERGRRLLTVFDEIDAGLGATAARAVAHRLRAVARHRQVLLVTHVPVIAAAGARHFRIGKARGAAGSVAEVELLDEAGRVAEVARMLSGDAHNDEACRHARSLLAERVR